MTYSFSRQGKHLRKLITESRLGPIESITKTFIVVVRLMAVISWRKRHQNKNSYLHIAMLIGWFEKVVVTWKTEVPMWSLDMPSDSKPSTCSLGARITLMVLGPLFGWSGSILSRRGASSMTSSWKMVAFSLSKGPEKPMLLRVGELMRRCTMPTLCCSKRLSK